MRQERWAYNARARCEHNAGDDDKMKKNVDFLVVGGGVMGVALAREIRRRSPRAAVLLIEKEPAVARHASGRNSGVLHAGFYYTADSLKARFCRDGNRALTEYCLERKLPIRRCGKLVVAKDANDLAGLDELLRRGRDNGVEVEEVDAPAAREIEPRSKTFERALWSPTTSSVDPAAVVASLALDARAEGVEIRTDAAYLGRGKDGVVQTAKGEIGAGFVVNAAGVYADRVARDFGFGERYAILPFKGLYLYSSEPALGPNAMRVHLYPVPDLGYPFLGVHFTITVEGKLKIGPTAIPALWREQYRGLENFDWGELGEVVRRQAGLFFHAGFDFRKLAFREVSKSLASVLARQAMPLAEGVHVKDYRTWGKPGIRAQLLEIATRKLVMDFVVEGDARSLHVLNAVSPAFTCSLPMAAHLADEIFGAG